MGRFDAALPYPQQVHEVQSVLALTDFLGAPAQGEYIEFPLWPRDHEAAAALLEGTESPLIGLHPAARDATRRWALDRFAAAGTELRGRYGGTLVLLGEKDEQATIDVLAQRVGKPCLNLVGKTSLTILGAVIAQLSVLVTNDTGPAHVAYTLRTPTVTVFGASNPERYGPCNYVACPIGYACLQSVTVSQVVEAAAEIIKLAPPGQASHLPTQFQEHR